MAETGGYNRKGLPSTDAVILAGGLGTRLRPVVSDRPKVLAPVGGRPFLTYLLDQLERGGIKRVVLSIGFRGTDVRRTFGRHYRGMELEYSEESRPLGTGGALRLAADVVHSNLLLAMNGDSFIDVNLNDFRSWFDETSGNAALLLARVAEISRFGQIEIDNRDRILRFDEKGGHARSGWISAGIYLLRTSLLSEIPPGIEYSLEHDFFPSLIKQGLYGYRCRSPFIDIGTPESYKHAPRFFQELGRSVYSGSNTRANPGVTDE